MRTNFSFFAKNISAIFVILCIGSSCKKEKDATCSPTVAAIAGTYKLAGLKYQQTLHSPEQDFLALKDDCEKDDLINLQAAGTWNYIDAGMVCSPSGTDAGTWSISGSTVISDGIVSGTIQSFDCHSLVVYSDNLIIPGDRITLTIVRQ
ncbi:MAG: lipocalin family protein [Chitinophagaceae bacterium]